MNKTKANGQGLEPLSLPAGITDCYVDCTASCGLNYHVLTAGRPGQPLILFCHGFPELAFSWRKVLPAIAEQGFYCAAMDQRGYGRTTGWESMPFHEVDLTQFTMTNLVRDLVCLVYKLGYRTALCIIGHDFGGVSSAMSALMRPDVFLSSIQMSHPHKMPPAPPLGDEVLKTTDIQAELASLSPPMKHYKFYNSTPEASHDWDNPAQGLEAYLRGYFHLKSADWKHNDPHPLKSWSGQGLTEMPGYYIMPKDKTFPEVIAHGMQGEDYSKTESWLPKEALAVYVSEWSRTGFLGALNWYRAQTASTPQSRKDLYLFAGRCIEGPAGFISGKQDWGNHQQPGAIESYDDEKIVKSGCFRGATLIDHAGHWVQQEQPEAVIDAITRFLGTL